MIAKLIVSCENRAAAIARLRSVLTQTVVFGVTTNIALLQAIAAHPAYSEGQTYTSFLDEHGLLEPGEIKSTEDHLTNALCAAALLELTSHTEMSDPRERNPWRALGPWRMVGEARSTTYEHQEQRYKVAVSPASEQRSEERRVGKECRSRWS